MLPRVCKLLPGVDFMEKIIERDDGRTVHFLVWDTAGQEEFDALTRSYYSGACRMRGVAI